MWCECAVPCGVIMLLCVHKFEHLNSERVKCWVKWICCLLSVYVFNPSLSDCNADILRLLLMRPTTPSLNHPHHHHSPMIVIMADIVEGFRTQFSCLREREFHVSIINHIVKIFKYVIPLVLIMFYWIKVVLSMLLCMRLCVFVCWDYGLLLGGI